MTNWQIPLRLRVISIVGPTASGKTALAIGLARRLGSASGCPAPQRCEILNADAYQMYRGMRIGTAAPSEQERQAVPHHLLGIIDPSEPMSVARFQKIVREEILRLEEQDIRPILVGGSGLYARAATDVLSLEPHDPDVRRRLERRAAQEGPSALFAELEERDPRAAAGMDPRNVRRTIRALEVIELTGRPYSSSLPVYQYAMPTLQIGLDLPRGELDRRIDLRTGQMREEGFLDEARALQGRLGPTAARAIGYPQMQAVLDGRLGEDDAFAQVAAKTRRLARKQMGWFGRDPRIHWLRALDPDLIDKAVDLVDLADDGKFPDDDGPVGPTQHHLGDVARSPAGQDRARADGQTPVQEGTDATGE
jgi:tRNA dimethylallyltransferase